MYTLTQNFLNAQAAGESPLALVFLQSSLGRRVYGLQSPTPAQMGSSGGLITYDGTVSVGDDVVFGSANIVLSWGPLLLTCGSLRETLTPEGLNILAGLKGAEIPDLTVRFDNTTGEFSDILASERVIGQTLLLRVGYSSLRYNDFLDIFTGRIVRQRLSDAEFEVTARAGTRTELNDAIPLATSARYANPKNANDPLPVVYGDCAAGSTRGVWKTVEIDTVNSKFLIADHPILSVANGNTISVYDQDGNAITSGFTAYTDAADENGRNIAYLDFTTAPGKDIFVRCKGKASGAALLENPVDILEDLLTTFGIGDPLNAPAFARARQLADGRSLTAAGVVDTAQSGAELMQSLLRTFLGDWWHNSSAELTVSLDAIGADTYNVAGFLRESDYADAASDTDETNMCNQAVMQYALNVATSSYDQRDDGSASADLLSQQTYGIQQRDFALEWARASATAQAIQTAILAKFSQPPRLLTVTENAFRNCHIERGDYVSASASALRDENGLPLKNQLWRVLEIEKNFDTFAISYLLQDTGYYYPEEPIIYDGTYSVGSYDGRVRERSDF